MCKKRNKVLNENSGRCIDVDSIDVGDKVWADLGGVELASGKVFNPDDRDIDGKHVVSFWSYSGWRHLEFAEPKQIVKVKKKN